MAREMPVLPLVGSKMVSPGRSRPDSSASRTMNSAGRSLMLPVGLRSSSLAQSRTGGAPSGTVGERRGRPARGVPSHASSRLSKRAIALLLAVEQSGGRGEAERAAGHRRQDGDRVTVAQLGVERAEEADVLVVDVDVDEPVQATLGGDQLALEARVLGVQVVDQAGERGAGALDDLRATGVTAQNGRNANFDSHDGDAP